MLKPIKYSLLASLCLFIPGCLLIRPEINIASDHDPNASFENYRTYSMVSNDLTVSPPIYKEVIEEQISRMLEIRGYRQNTINPDLLVFYSLFPGKVSINTLSRSYGRYNGITNKSKISLSPTRTTIKGGALVIQLIDAKSGSPVWLGHVTGLLTVQSVNQETYIQHKIRLLFDKYDYFAHDFLVSRYKAKSPREIMPFSILQRQANSIR